ncbi:MAG: glycosyltransferase [Pleurocapsa sp.]
MQNPIVTIFYQFDPLNPTIGGIQTCIKYIIKYAPQEFQLRIVGTGSDPSIAVGEWHEVELYGRKFLFMPLFHLENDNVRQFIPTSVKYTIALLKHRFNSDFLQFHRLEPTMATYGWSGSKIFYIHNDLDQAVKLKNGQNGKGGILWRRFPWAYFALERLLVGQFDRIFSCNTNSAQRFQKSYPDIAQRVTYLPNTVDSELFYPLTSAEKQQQRVSLARQLGLKEETCFFLFAGRLHPQKQPLLLIRSLAVLNKAHVHLLIVGQGELEPEIRAEIAKLQLTDRVTMLGPVTQDKLAELYRIASLFVLTSAYEGLARGSIEALACGTPVVTTRVGETPNFLTAKSGIVCEEQSASAIADAFKQVLEHPEYYSAEACVEVAQPYNAYDVVGRIYGELLQQWQDQNISEPKYESNKV